MKRRNLLKGLAGAAASAPFLSILSSGAQAACPDGPKRIIVMSYPMGNLGPLWRPSQSGTDFTLPYCTAPLEAFRNRCLFVSNVDNKVMEVVNRYTYGHPHKKESALTGTLLRSAFGAGGQNRVRDLIDNEDQSGGANAASIDAVVGRSSTEPHTHRAVNLGIIGRETRDTELASAFSWESAGNPASLLLNPQLALQEYLGSLSPESMPPDPIGSAASRRQSSILDAVRQQFSELRTGLDYRDRQQLDFHADYIRQIEVDITTGGSCRAPTGIPGDRMWHNGASLRDAAQLQTRILAQSMACNVAPVGRLEFLIQQNPFFGIPSVDDPIAMGRAALAGDWGWHGLCHTNPSQNDPATGRPSRPRLRGGEVATEDMYSPHLREGMRFYVQAFADLLAELDRFAEGPDGRTVLDNSLCVLASDMGEGHGHRGNGMGYILAGNLGPFRTGYHFDAAEGSPDRASLYDHTHVLTTIAQAFCLRDEAGAEINYFGIEGFSSEGALPVLRA
jgi:hypothetical protein